MGCSTFGVKLQESKKSRRSAVTQVTASRYVCLCFVIDIRYEHARIKYCLVTLKFELRKTMMNPIALVRTYFVSRKREAIRRKNWKRKQSMKRRKAFARRQLEERVTFMFLLEMVSLSWLVPPARAIWCKERSSH